MPQTVRDNMRGKGPTEGSNPEPQIEPEPHRPGSETAHGVAGETTLYEDCQ